MLFQAGSKDALISVYAEIYADGTLFPGERVLDRDRITERGEVTGAVFASRRVAGDGRRAAEVHRGRVIARAAAVVDAAAIVGSRVARDGAAGEVKRRILVKENAAAVAGLLHFIVEERFILSDTAAGEMEIRAIATPTSVDAAAIARRRISGDFAAGHIKGVVTVHAAAILGGRIARDGSARHGSGSADTVEPAAVCGCRVVFHKAAVHGKRAIASEMHAAAVFGGVVGDVSVFQRKGGVNAIEKHAAAAGAGAVVCDVSAEDGKHGVGGIRTAADVNAAAGAGSPVSGNFRAIQNQNAAVAIVVVVITIDAAAVVRRRIPGDDDAFQRSGALRVNAAAVAVPAVRPALVAGGVAADGSALHNQGPAIVVNAAAVAG